MKRSKKILGLMAVMALGILAGCSSVSNAAKPTTRLVASSKNSEQAWISTYGLKDKDPVSYVFVFKGNKVAAYDFSLGAKLSDFKGLSNSQVIKKAKNLNASQAKKLIVHEKTLVSHIQKSQENNKEIKDIVESWNFKTPGFNKYKVAKYQNPSKEELTIVNTGSDYGKFSMDSSLSDLLDEAGALSKGTWENEISFKLTRTVKTDKWSGYKISGINDEGVGTHLVQPGSRKVTFDK